MSEEPKEKLWRVSKHAAPDHAPQYGIYDENLDEGRRCGDIATVFGPDSKENAHLMAAAPKMRQMLEKCYEILNQDDFYCDTCREIVAVLNEAKVH